MEENLKLLFEKEGIHWLKWLLSKSSTTFRAAFGKKSIFGNLDLCGFEMTESITTLINNLKKYMIKLYILLSLNFSVNTLNMISFILSLYLTAMINGFNNAKRNSQIDIKKKRLIRTIFFICIKKVIYYS